MKSASREGEEVQGLSQGLLGVTLASWGNLRVRPCHEHSFEDIHASRWVSPMWAPMQAYIS